MEEIVLSKSSLFYMDLPKGSLLDNDKLRSDCLVFDELSEQNNNYDKDRALPNSKELTWVSDVFRDYLFKKEKYDIEPVRGSNVRLIVNSRDESTIMRNHIEYLDLESSPDFIGLYFVHADKNDKAIFHYDNHRKKDLKWEIPITPKKLILFHSGINYYLPPNKSFKKRIALLYKFQLLP